MFAATSLQARYNMLVFDSAKDKAFIEAFAVDYMEQYAY